MQKYIILALRIGIAVMLIQTLWFKFGAHPDSVYIFSTIGMEPYGRIGTGVMELIAGILILIPKTIWAGAGLTLGLMGGAIFMHLTILGIDINGDGGGLFYFAVGTFIAALAVTWVHRKDMPFSPKQ